MEQRMNNGNRAPESAEMEYGWEAWEAIPRDGPAVFVIDTAAFDRGVIRGRWIEVAEDDAELQAALTELLGQKPEEGSWAVVDQIGLGPVMAPETMAVSELATVESELGTGRAR